MNENDQPGNTAGELYSNSRSQKVPPSGTTNDERYSTTNRAPEQHVAALPPPPLSQSLQRATTTIDITKYVHGTADAVPTLAGAHLPRPLRRWFLPLLVAVAGIVLFGALFVTYQHRQPPQTVASIQSKATADAQKASKAVKATAISYLATATALAREPYRIAVPGRCNGDVRWSDFPQEQYPDSIQCLSDSAKLTYHGSTNPNNASPSLSFNAKSIGSTTPYASVDVTVTQLSAGMCLTLSLSSVQDMYVDVCQGGTWMVTLYQGQSTPLQFTNVFHPHNPQSFIIQAREDSVSVHVSVDDIPLKTFVENNAGAPAIYSNGVYVNIGLRYADNSTASGSVNLKDFEYFPLFASGS